jgi:hypothetical protein
MEEKGNFLGKPLFSNTASLNGKADTTEEYSASFTTCGIT